jgi:hypothetical protein
LRPRKRGRRGGIREKTRRRIFKLAMPSIILGNAQSLRNKTDELEACVRYLREYREANLVCLSETWLSGMDLDPDLPGFSVMRSDRSRTATGKKQGGGVCVYVNEKWCTNVTAREEFCSKDIELLSVALRPFYLPREFQRVFVSVVYIPPKADVKAAADKIREVVMKQESTCPDSIRLVLGDFNVCRLSKVLPNYRQYVTCKTCKDSTLDLCYGNVARAYKSIPLPSLGRSVHNMISLLPMYKSRLKSCKPKKKTVRQWSLDVTLALDACFYQTDWDVFREASASLEEAVEAVTAYINFCTESLVPVKEVKIFPNNKPWVTGDVADLLKMRQKKFREGDQQEVKNLQAQLKVKIRENKEKYKKKVEESFNTDRPRKMWQSLNTMTGYKPGKKSINIDDAQALADELNQFYARFDEHDFSAEQADVLERVKQRESQPVIISVEEVSACFQNINVRSAHGPDNIPGMILKRCHLSLAPVFTKLFQESLDTGEVPTLWKTAVVVPVPKKPSPKVNNDYRPVALTSVPFKCLERLLLRRLLEYTQPHQDPYQFAYMANRSTEDAINTLLHGVYKHLEQPKTYVRMLFLDFSSAFNTIQPHLLAEKLLRMEVNPALIQWVHSFLTGRQQKVRISGARDVMSKEIVTNTGAPQGCVTSPALFTIYTSDCRCREEGVLQIKFSDDTSISGLIMDDDEAGYRKAVDSMVSWCEDNFLLLNVSKTKEMIIDFRRKPPALSPLIINGEQVEVVTQYKYLGTILDHKLDWTDNTTQLVKKGNKGIYFLKKLRSFDVQMEVLRLFYQAVVQSVISFNSLCFHNNLKAVDASRLAKLTRTASGVIGAAVTDLTTLYTKKAVRRVRAILGDPSHPLRCEFSTQQSNREGSTRLRSMKCRTDRFKNSFVPSAIRVCNNDI